MDISMFWCLVETAIAKPFILVKLNSYNYKKTNNRLPASFFSGVFNTMYNANEQTNYFMKQKPGLNYSALRANFQEKLKSFPQQLHVVWNEYFENTIVC